MTDVPTSITAVHPWPSTVDEAQEVQGRLAPRIDRHGRGPIEADTVAGLDIAYDVDSDLLVAAAVVLDVATLEVLDRVTVPGTADFAYVPGLLAFRELPTLIRALDRVSVRPQVLVCDGYGLAHPRRFGLACHVGIVTGLPTVGVAKTPYVGEPDQLGPHRGDRADLVDRGEVIGRALRTQDGVKPVYVSVGHRTGLDAACDLVLALAPRYRQPEPIRQADQLSRSGLATQKARPARTAP